LHGLQQPLTIIPHDYLIYASSSHNQRIQSATEPLISNQEFA
jgi:hypothetical protein